MTTMVQSRDAPFTDEPAPGLGRSSVDGGLAKTLVPIGDRAYPVVVMDLGGTVQ